MKVFIALSVLATGCAAMRFHRDRNAPGHIDVATPGPDTGLERPRDPGENMIAVNPGVLAAAGGRGSDPHFVSELSVEVAVNVGTSERSHFEDDFIIHPHQGIGGVIGWSLLRGLGASDADYDLGPVYVEVQLFRPLHGAGVGYAVDPARSDHGPQVNAFAGPLFVRGRYLFDGGVELQIGLQLKLPIVWVWSR